MRFLRLFLVVPLAALLAGVAPVPSPSPAPAAPIHLTLEHCIELATQGATNVLQAQNNEQLSATQLLQSYAEFLPNLGLSAQYAYSNGKSIFAVSGLNVVDSSSNSANYQITSTLNLFNGLADYSAFKAALARKSSSELTLEFARQQISIDVAQSYLQTILDQQLIGIARKSLEASEARLRLIQGRVEVGSASTADLFRQEAQVSADRVTLTGSETRQHDDLLLLLRKLRLDPTADYLLEEPPLESTAPALADQPEDGLLREALSHRKDLHSLASSVDASHWNVTNARAGYYPRLDLSFSRTAAGVYLHHQDLGGVDVIPPTQQGLGGQLRDQVNYVVALSLSWSIFDRFLTRAAVEQAQVASDNLEIQYEDLRLQVLSQVRQARLDFGSAREQLRSARVGLEAAQKALSVIEGRYRVGASSFIDVLDAQSALVQAQGSLAQALIGVKLQEKLLEFAVGRF